MKILLYYVIWNYYRNVELADIIRQFNFYIWRHLCDIINTGDCATVVLILKRTRKYKVKIISKRNCEAFWIAWNETMSLHIFGVSGWNDFSQLGNISILLCCFCSTVCGYFRTVIGAKTRNNIMAAFSQERKSVFCTVDNASAPKACRIGSFSSPTALSSLFLLTIRIFPRFPSVLICLFQWGRGLSSRASRRYARSSRIYRNL